jgi:cytoskeletal protein CcmA (bactofilin family)
MTNANNADRKTTFVEEGTELRGSLVSNCPIEVNGIISGDVTAAARS